MGLGYIVLNGKRYRTSERTFEERHKKSQQVNVTIGATTISQDFGFTDKTWSMRILVEFTPTDANYGSVTDLQTAYGLAYMAFTDVYGASQGNVFFTGELGLPPKMSLVDTTAPFEVDISLRSRQI